MSSKTVNEDLLIVTQGSKHLADTKQPKDRCFLRDKVTIRGFRNYIPTSACDNAQATQRTLIRSYRIVHSKSKIGTDYGQIPSKDDNFNGFGGGVANGQVYFKHANDYPKCHSKNVKVEGSWIVRTNDETQQNKRNCTGRFREGDAGITENELEALLNKGCTVESVTLKCGHGRDTTTGRIWVLEGDTVTVAMVHVNDAEVEPAARARPSCQVPRRKAEGKLPADAKAHPYYRVTRSAYPKTSFREALPALTKEIPGLTITLGKEWLGSGPPPKKEPGNFKINAEKEAPDITAKDTYDKIGKVSGAPVLEGARIIRDLKIDDTRIPAQQAVGRAEVQAALKRDMEMRALREQIVNRTTGKVAQINAREDALETGRKATKFVETVGATAITSYYALKEVFYAKPVEIKVEALACAGAKPVTIAAYPPGKYSVDIADLKDFKVAFAAARDTISRVRDFLRKIKGTGEQEEGAGPSVQIEAGRFRIQILFLLQPLVFVGVEFRELSRDSVAGEAPGRKKHEVHRAFTVEVGIERLIGIKFGYSIPIAYAVGAFGVFVQKLMDCVGADLSFKIELELSAGVSGAFELNEYGKFVWLQNTKAYFIGKFTVSLNAQTAFANFSIGILVEWKPVFELQPVTNQPFVVKRLPSKVDIRWFVKAAVDIFGWTVDLEYGGSIWTGDLGEARYALS